MLLINVHSQLSKTYLQIESEKIDKKDAKQRLEYISNAIDGLTQAITLIRHRIEEVNNESGDEGEGEENQNDEIEETVCKDLQEKLTQMRYECFVCYIKQSQIHVYIIYYYNS